VAGVILPARLSEYAYPAFCLLYSASYFACFKSLLKKKIIEYAMNKGESLWKIAHVVGVSPGTVMKHLERDAAFRTEIERAKRWYAQRVEGVLMERAIDPKATLDRIAYLRAYMPEKYARQELSNATVEININMDQLKTAKSRKIVDADAVTVGENDPKLADHSVMSSAKSVEG
jgi:hypothetical protein